MQENIYGKATTKYTALEPAIPSFVDLMLYKNRRCRLVKPRDFLFSLDIQTSKNSSHSGSIKSLTTLYFDSF